jgi:hypothetical protein
MSTGLKIEANIKTPLEPRSGNKTSDYQSAGRTGLSCFG